MFRLGIAYKNDQRMNSIVNKDNKKWIVVASYFILSVVIPIIVSVTFATLKIENPTSFDYWMMVVEEALILAVCIACLFNDILLEMKKDSLKRILAMAGIFFVVFILLNAAAGWVYPLIGIDVTSSINQQIMAEMKRALPKTLFCFSCVIMGPISEELVFRFALYNLIIEICGHSDNASLIAIIGSSMCFGIMHSGFSIMIVPYFLIGVFFCAGYVYSKNIIPVILVHSVNNIIAIGIL